MVPIPCPEKLLEWAKSTTWRRLTRFIDMRGARGHSPETIDRFVKIQERRRWDQENKTYRERSNRNRVLTNRERIWNATQRKIEVEKTLSELRAIDPYEFERLVADIFDSQGYRAMAVGGVGDGGIDVKVWDQQGELWAIAQCKRYDATNIISPTQIRDFAGAFLISNAKEGFFFTTSDYSKSARRAAREYPWLSLFNGKQFVNYATELKYEFELLNNV